MGSDKLTLVPAYRDRGTSVTRWGGVSRGFPLYLPLAVTVVLATTLAGCSQRTSGLGDGNATAPGEQAQVAYDTTVPKPVPVRDKLERSVYRRGGDLMWVDKRMDGRTRPTQFDRKPLPATPPDTLISEGVEVLNDTAPFPEPVPLPPKEVTIRVGIARSTYHTREREEVLSALQPFIDLVQREVNVRSAAVLYETAEQVYFGLLDGEVQMAISNVFDYLLVGSWFASLESNGVVPLAWARPAHPRTTELDRMLPGILGTSVELLVAADSRYSSIRDLKGTRLAVAANYSNAPGTFLAGLLNELNHPSDQPFFTRVILRRYAKDAVIDLLKGKADVACVDQGTIGALDRFYGLSSRIRTLAVSPRYNVDVLYSSLNNVTSHRTEIELTQTQLTTLGKDPEGEEVLFFFDTEAWNNYRAGDLATPRRYFEDYLEFIDDTPVDLRPLLDPKADVDRQTYDRYGDE